MTLSMRYFVEAGRTRPLDLLMIISRKLPPNKTRRGLMSSQTSGSTFFSFGLGRDALRSAAVARPTPRDGRSTDFMPPPYLDGPKEDIDWLEFTLFRWSAQPAGFRVLCRRAAIKDRTQNSTYSRLSSDVADFSITAAGYSK